MRSVRTRALLLVLLLLAPALTGCVDALDRTLRGEHSPTDGLHEPDATTYRFVETNITIEASDGVALRATMYKPRPATTGETFPAVVFVHGWGGNRGTSESESQSVEQMRRFAAEGYTVLAYDVRGFGESGGESTLGGPREMQDLREVVDHVVNATPWDGKLGLVGRSYGGAHAMWGLVHDERVTTAVSHYGWLDLAEGLAPGGIPKPYWVTALLLIGMQGQGRYDPIIYDWLQRAGTRQDFDEVLDALRARSTYADLPNLTKPVMLVEGTDETLFPQALEGYTLLTNAQMRKVYLYNGGHGSRDAEAWDRTLQWFDRHLKDEDSGVDAWPDITYPDPTSSRRIEAATFPIPGTQTLTLNLSDDTPLDGEGALTTDAPAPGAAARYTGSARSGAADDPSVLRDLYGARGAPAPARLRAAPGEAVIFRGEPLDAAAWLVGSPVLNLTLAPTGAPGLQVVARLYDEAPDGQARLLARGGVDPSPLAAPGTVEFALTRAIAKLDAGHRLVLVVAGDDASYTAPYPTPFTAEARFGGETGARLLVPLTPIA